jgi:membrane-associated phospholipid phosphatase
MLLHTVWWRFRHLVALRALGIFALLTGIGLLVAHPLEGALAGEAAVNRFLEDRRTPTWNTITHYASTVGNTEIIIATTLAVAAVLRVLCGRWREAVFLMVAVALAATIFTLTTFPVERSRPDVVQLDPAPPTSSFPSGHVGAATALYGGLALLLWRRRPCPSAWLVPLALAVPLAVAAARLYRGMHFVSDTAVGVLNGVLCIALAAHAYLRDQPHKPPNLE